MTPARQRLGRQGEDRALARYEAHGWTLVDRNVRTRRGELDLLVERGGVLAVVEVKARSSARHGTGFDAVGHRKQRTIRQLTAAYLTAGERHWHTVRFDVAWVSPTGVRVLEGAF